MVHRFVALQLGLLSCVTACAQLVQVANTRPRLDDQGQIVDAHDGRISKFGDTFYWYGTAYGETNSFTPANHYRCYSSKDMQVWYYEGCLLPEQPEGVYYRPHVIYNAQTRKYVLWYNWYPKLWNGQFGVAINDSPLKQVLLDGISVMTTNHYQMGELAAQMVINNDWRTIETDFDYIDRGSL
ncbi:MAG: hypothetical protein D6772_04945 [Bacteroidetes bacterium]|nr:MAG: hypothetical protein D6772_04945 [Bacteroidota bacterium]